MSEVFSVRLGGSGDTTGLTADQLAANRQTAESLVASQLGLDLADHLNWTYDQENQYNVALAHVYLTYPDRFSSTDLQNAQHILSHGYQSLSDVGLGSDFETFTSALGDQLMSAGSKVADIGTGVLDAASGIGKGISAVGGIAPLVVPIIALAFAGIFVLGYKKKKGV